MKRSGKLKTLRSLAWLVIASLTMTTVAPGLTVFAGKDQVNVSVSAHKEDKENGKSLSAAQKSERSSSSDWEDATEDKNEDLTEPDDDEEKEDDYFDGLIDLVPASPSEATPATPSDAEKAVCEFNGEYYDTLEKAVSATEGGTGTITLLKDTSLSERLWIKNGTITFDLGGFTLTGEVYVTNGSEVTVENGTIDSGKGYWCVFASGDDENPTRFTLAENAKITAIDYGLLLCGVQGSSDKNGTGFVVIIDGVVEVTDPESSGIWLQGKMQTTTARVCDLIVNGTVKSGLVDGPGIAINGWGNVTINEDAKVTGATGIEIRSGSLTINGGTIEGSTEKFSSVPNTHGSTSTGAGITINEHTTDKPINVYISGGEISGYYALTQINTQQKEDKIDLSVTGGVFKGYDTTCILSIEEYADGKGRFSIFGGMFTDNLGNRSDISRYLGSGYEQDETGKVASLNPVVNFGDSSYSSIEDAISAAQKEDHPTITMTGDLVSSEPVNIAEDQRLDIDLGAHTVTITGDDAGFINKGNLTISGSGTIMSAEVAISNEGTSLTIAPDATVISQNDAAIANLSGDLNISGTVKSEGASAVIAEGGRVNMTGGAVTGSNAVEVRGGEVNISGGTLTAADGYAVYVGSGKVRDEAYVIIEGGEFITYGEDCIYYGSAIVPRSSDTTEPSAPVAIYCGSFSNERGLERFYATVKTEGRRNGRYFDVFTYEQIDVTEPDCITEGNTTYVCSYCSREYTEDIKEALGHDWGRWEIISEATADEDGEMVRMCGRCHATETAIISKTGDDDNPGEDVAPGDTETTPDEVTGGDNKGDEGSDNNTGSSVSTGHHSSGGSRGGGSTGTGQTSISQTYTDVNGKKAEWFLSGLRFTKTDGTHPSNEYLIIDGAIYAFYTNGYAISFDNAAYYSADAVPAIEDIPVVEGTWELCGWWLKYFDGSYPRNDWAVLTHNGQTDRYYFDADGWMVTGWQLIDGCWYYFGGDGALLTDTIISNGYMVDKSR